jgi:hypothetical protein
MTYPPGNPGYPPPPQPNQFNAPNPGPNQPYGRAPERIPAAPSAPAAPAGPSNLPLYLTAAVAVLGLLVFGFSFAAPYGLKGDTSNTDIPRDILTFLPAIAAVAAGLLAGVDLLPKQKNFKAWVAILAVLGLLLAIVEIAQVPQVPPMLVKMTGASGGFEATWALYCVLAFSVLQAGAALAALLLDAGVIQPPAPKPQVDPYGYGAPGQYYGQPGQQHAPQHNAPQAQGQQYGQQGGYQQPGAYPGARPQHSADDSSPATPATGFSAFGQAPSAGTAPEAGSAYPGASAPPAGASEATQTFQQQQAPQQSDPASS